MANCVFCNSSTTERAQNKRGGAVAAIHNDCAHHEDQLYWAQKWNDKPLIAILQSVQARLTAKRAGQPTQWP